jgi:hypothetical protein
MADYTKWIWYLFITLTASYFMIIPGSEKKFAYKLYVLRNRGEK